MKFIITFLILSQILFNPIFSEIHKISDNQKKVNKLNILLPQIFSDLETRAPHYSLEAINGCYKWQSSNPKVLQVNGMNDQQNPNCQSQAVVKLNTIETFDNIVWIEVTDKNTEDVIKVESKVAKVVKIEILTKLRTVDVQDLSVLEIIGYDNEGNSFSSLEGLHFEWSIMQDEKIFEFITFKESKIQTTQIRKNIEDSHFQSDLIVIKAMQTGQAQINVKLKEKNYDLQSQNITLQAIDKFDIYPSNNLYLLPYSYLQYQLMYSKKSKGSNQIDLNQGKYEWKIDDDKVGTISQAGQLLSLEKLNVPAKVTVKPKKDVNYQVTSTVTVVDPYSLEILIKEFTDNDIWERNDKETLSEKFRNKINLVKDREYYMRIVLYDQSRNQIKVTKNVEIDTLFDQIKFKVLEKRNHNEYKIKPLQLVNSTEITAELKKIAHPFDQNKVYIPKNRQIKNTVQVDVVMPVKLFKPSETIYLPNLNKQLFKLNVIGGSGEYKWDSTDNTVFETSQSRIHPTKPGFAKLYVSDKYNENNRDVVDVYITDAQKLQPLEQMMEVLQDGEVKTFGFAFFNSFNNTKVRFSNCSALYMNVNKNNFFSSFPNQDLSYENMLQELQSLKNSNTYIQKILQQYQIPQFQGFDEYIKLGLITTNQIQNIYDMYNNYGICSQFTIKAEQTGEFTGKLLMWEGNDGQKQQQYEEQNSLSVKVFRPFQTIIDKKYFSFFKQDEVIISMNSKFNWAFNYGPSQWESQRKININTLIQAVTDSKDCDQITHNIPQFTTQGNVTQQYTLQCGLCKKQQENQFLVSLFMQNEQDEKLPRPLLMQNKLRLWCNVPHSLYIYPLQEPKGKFEEWENAKISKFQSYYVRHNMDHFFHINVFDSRNLPFFAFQTLKIDWSISSPICGDIIELSQTQIKDKCENYSQIGLQNLDQYRKYRTNECYGKQNTVIKINAVSKQLEDEKNSYKGFNVNDEIVLNLSPNVECNPPSVNLFNHVLTNYQIELLYGSGYFLVSNNSTDIVQHEQIQRNIRIQTLRNGASNFLVKDQQQIGGEEIQCKVQVREPSQVILKLAQDIIPVGGTTEAYVEVLNDQGKPFSDKQIEIMDIFLESDTSGEEQWLQISNRSDLNEPNSFKQTFSINGKKKGNYRLVATLKHNNPQNFRYPSETRMYILKSNSVDLEVFPKLEAYPPNLVLHQLCQTSLQLIGGPSDSTRVKFYTRFMTENQQIISLQQIDSKLYDVKALQNAKGRVNLEFSIKIQNEQKLLSSVIVPIQVEDIDDVKIYGMNDRVLHLGTTVRLIAQIFMKGEQMSISMCPLNIVWSSKLDGVLKVSQNIPSHLIDNNTLYAVNATAVDIGVSEIELTIHYTEGNNNKKYVKTVAKVDIIQPAVFPIPTYVSLPDRKPSFLLIPPKSGYFIPLPNIQKYNFESSLPDQINVDQNGHITIGEKKGLSGHVKVQNNNIQQDTMSIHVHVVSIYSLIVENSHTVSQMQIEGESQHTVRMQDFLGRSFPTQLDNVRLSVRVTNSKVLSAVILDNSVLQLRAISKGVSICTVYLETNPHIYDTFVVSVDSIVTPSSPVNVHVGGWVQFAIQQGSRGSSNLNGKWYSHNENIVSVDHNTGIARALQEGESIVEYNDGVFYKSKVYVKQIGEVVCKTKNLVFTNWKRDVNYKDEYRVMFQAYVKDKNGGKEALQNYKDQNQVNNNLIFSCKIQKLTDRKWFSVNTIVHDDHIECVIRLHEFSNLYPNQYMPTQLLLVVRAESKSENSNFSFFQEFKFSNLYWGIVIPENNINLNKNNFEKNIIIQTNVAPHIQVKGSTSKNIIQSQQFKSAENLYEIHISVEDKSEKFNKTIIVRHPQTNQIEAIEVSYDPQGEYSSTINNGGQQQSEGGWDLYSFPWSDVFIGIIIVGITMIVFNTVYLQK